MMKGTDEKNKCANGHLADLKVMFLNIVTSRLLIEGALFDNLDVH